MNKKKEMKNKKAFAFTLAETLITLTIIGVVAALTIPNLIQKYEKQTTITKVKEMYSILNQAIKQGEIENGPIINIPANLTEEERTTYFYEHYLLPNLSIAKRCAPLSDECWKSATSLSRKTGYLNNNELKSAYQSLILNNGVSLYYWVASVTGNESNAQIWFDIDGPNKGPAVIGKDIFGINYVTESHPTRKAGVNFACGNEKSTPLTREQLINDANYGCSTAINTVYAGRCCGALMQYDGWQIKDDYPW